MKLFINKNNLAQKALGNYTKKNFPSVEVMCPIEYDYVIRDIGGIPGLPCLVNTEGVLSTNPDKIKILMEKYEQFIHRNPI
jgi:hypothetical protein